MIFHFSVIKLLTEPSPMELNGYAEFNEFCKENKLQIKGLFELADHSFTVKPPRQR